MTTLTNAPESEGLTLADADLFEDARIAIGMLKRTFDTWVKIGHAVQRARKIADERGGRKTFQRLLEQQGLAKEVPPATATRLLAIMENLPAVEKWRRDDLDDKERFEWASPSTVFKHCPIFSSKAKPASPTQAQHVDRKGVVAGDPEDDAASAGAGEPQRKPGLTFWKQPADYIMREAAEAGMTIDQLEYFAEAFQRLAEVRRRKARERGKEAAGVKRGRPAKSAPRSEPTSPKAGEW